MAPKETKDHPWLPSKHPEAYAPRQDEGAQGGLIVQL